MTSFDHLSILFYAVVIFTAKTSAKPPALHRANQTVQWLKDHLV